jgi:CTP synthase
MPDQRDVTDKGGTMRLGSYPAKLQPGTKTRAAYGDEPVVYERHRHRFEFNNRYRAVRGGRVRVLGAVAGRPPGRVHRAAPTTRGSSRPRPTRVQVPPQPPAPAVRRVRRAARQRHRELRGQLPVELDEPTAAELEDAVEVGDT